MPFNIGVDLCDDYITAYALEDKSLFSVPAVICREKKEDAWHIGEEAYRVALSGRGVLTDKLLSLMKKQGVSTIQKRAYGAVQLLSKLIYTVLRSVTKHASMDAIDRLVIVLKDAEKGEMDAVLRAAELTGISAGRISIISRSEAFVHYLLAQDRELSYNMSGLFDLYGDSLSFYRIKIVRGGGKERAVAERTDLEEAFRIGILKNESGFELGDRIITEAARKCIGSDIYSSIMLTGRGFERTDWAKGFIEFICRKRRVLYEEGLFAIGAAIYAPSAAGRLSESGNIYCDTRTESEISLDVDISERRSRLIMVPAGSPWHETDIYAEVILKNQNYIDISIDPVERSARKRTARITLDGFPDRPDRCTRVSVGISFESAADMVVRVADQGFGEIFPSSGMIIEEKIKLG